ncbi:Vacuolar protein sorting-associated protein ist1 [Marasmius crinis-equi]|uniref:Vacuolar protein sorting-associated protein ist1 n=1 Tax=Marasmius crinis-equi TaxID=585013 RepID=A0ABR3FNP2_9AGAR
MPPWNSAKAKVQLRLSVQRLRTLQQKKEAQAKAARRDIASLIERGKIETAKIKVEGIINEDIHVELLELLELYCELLLARFGVLDQNAREPDPGVAEGVCSIIFAAPRTELKELHVLRDILMHKYGREFSLKVMDAKEGVSERVARKLEVITPTAELVDGYMAEIARGYGIAYNPTTSSGSGSQDDSGGTSGGDVKEPAAKEDEGEEDIKLPETKPSTPKLPDIPPTEDEEEKNKSKPSAKPPTPGPPPSYEDDLDALAKRFAALKKR